MEIKIHAKHITLTDYQKQYIQKKIDHLKKLAKRGDDESSQCTVEVEHVEHKDPSETIGIKINLVVPHHTFHAEGFGSTVEETIDILEEKIERQIEHSKRD